MERPRANKACVAPATPNLYISVKGEQQEGTKQEAQRIFEDSGAKLVLNNIRSDLLVSCSYTERLKTAASLLKSHFKSYKLPEELKF